MKSLDTMIDIEMRFAVEVDQTKPCDDFGFRHAAIREISEEIGMIHLPQYAVCEPPH